MKIQIKGISMHRIVFCALFALSAPLMAQQITRFGVVDTAKVYSAYFKNSAAVRSYEKKKSEAQEEINKRTEELRALKERLAVGYGANISPTTPPTAPIESQGAKVDSDGKKREKLESEIARKTQSLSDFAQAKNIELENMRKSLQNSDDFYKKLYAVIARVAEQGGYSAILSVQQAGGLLWYSPSVDVTEDVIAALGK